MEKDPESLAEFPTVDLSLLRRNPVAGINKIREACHRYGFFHVINHGISGSVIEEALDVNANFFEMPMAAKQELISDDIYKSVRFCKVEVKQFSRDFLKLYAYPLDHFITCWPTLPPSYREKMGMYSTQVRKLSIELFGAIMKSLNLHQTHLQENFEQGFQILGVNCHLPCSGSNTKTGQPPHTDHSIITVLLQSSPGLELIDRVDGRSWKSVPELKGSLQVLVGDHLEVMSNGLYKSVLHRAIPSCGDHTRLSIASLHSLGMDEIVEPAAELESDKNPRMYRGSSLRDFLNHLAYKDQRCFIETLKINNQVDS